MTLIYLLIIGAISGWLAGQIMKGGGYGLLGNIILGIIGSFVGGWLLGVLNISLNIGSATVSTIIQAVIGRPLRSPIIGKGDRKGRPYDVIVFLHESPQKRYPHSARQIQCRPPSDCCPSQIAACQNHTRRGSAST